MGLGQRRLSHSPRSQRSRSADVDCLKKFAERKLFEERKLTDVCDFDTQRQIPLSRDNNNFNRPQLSSRDYVEYQRNPRHRRESFDYPGQSKIDSTRWLPVINRKVCPENMRRSSQENIDDFKYAKQPAGRSLSSESGYTRPDNYFRERKNSQFELYGRGTVEKTRWLLSEISTSKYIPSPLARKYSEGSSSKPISNRWMTFTRYPSPSPIVRRNTERRPFNNDSKRAENNWFDRENTKARPANEYKAVQIMKQPSIDSVRLNQRIRELYDIKTENEWPKRLKPSLGDNAWISKSSSEEDKYPQGSERRNSQELEFNDRKKKFAQPHDVKHKKSIDSTFEIDWDERLRKFHEKLRFSEDLTIDKKVQARNRTYSDDYEDYSRRQSSVEHFDKGVKRNSDASSRSRVSYAEIDFSDMSKRGSRTSDASYASISTYSPKRGSLEGKKNIHTELISQRTFNQLEERRPSTPVPPKKMSTSRNTEEPLNQRVPSRVRWKP